MLKLGPVKPMLSLGRLMPGSGGPKIDRRTEIPLVFYWTLSLLGLLFCKQLFYRECRSVGLAVCWSLSPFIHQFVLKLTAINPAF